MRPIALLVAAPCLFLNAPAQAAYEFYVKVKGAARDAPSGPTFLKVESNRDDDADGKPDEGVLRLVCAGEKIQSISFHHNVKSPRDSASGMASGKQASSHAIVKEWGPSTPQFFASYRPLVRFSSKPMAAARSNWVPVTLSDANGLCSAAASIKARPRPKQDQSHDVHELEKISRSKR